VLRNRRLGQPERSNHFPDSVFLPAEEFENRPPVPLRDGVEHVRVRGRSWHERYYIPLLEYVNGNFFGKSGPALTDPCSMPTTPAELPSVAEILDVDREYRESAEHGSLKRIAPKRMNPGHEAWLPVLHTARGARRYTVLFSNTPRAHEHGKTRDWVVLYYREGGSSERQCTVITSERGALQGKRIVRGREAECARYYEGSA
jgi:hypothetical protein